MASSFIPHLPLLLLLILLLPSFLHPTTTAAARLHPRQAASDLVARVCSQTADSAFCAQALAADNRTASADLTALGHISIDLLLQNATSTRGYVGDLLAKETEPKTSEYLLFCTGYYGEIIDFAGYCAGHLESKKYQEMNMAANQAFSDAAGCEATFNMNPSRSCPLTKQNNDAMSLGEIVSAVASLLEYPSD